MRTFRRWAAMLVVAPIASPMPSVAADAACPDTGDDVVSVTAVEPRLDLRLADGRLLRLVGVDPASGTPTQPDLADTVRRQVGTLIAGHRVSARILGTRPDRWGRLPAIVFTEDKTGHPTDLAVTAIGAGLARVLAEPAAHACRDNLIEAERAARDARLGLWRDPYYTVLGPDDRSAFAERSATSVVAEGTLTRVEVGPYRTKLRFAARDRWDRDVLVASILPRTVKLFEEQGVKVQSLFGKKVRVRGLLDLRFGPQIELTSPDAIEILSPETPPPTPVTNVVDHG